MIKNNKKEILIWCITVFLSLVICHAFLQPHYTHDTYKIMGVGYAPYAYGMYVTEARLVTAMLTILADFLKVPIQVYMVLSFIASIMLLAAAVIFVYKQWQNRMKATSIVKKGMLFLIAYITIFSYTAIEHIYFLEAAVMSLGVLLSVLASNMMIQQEKYHYIKTSVLLLIAVFCYQGSIAIFPMLLLAYYAFLEPLHIKKFIQTTFKIALLYGGMMLISILYSQLLFGDTRMQIGTQMVQLATIWETGKTLVIESLHIIPPYIHIGIIVCAILAIVFVTKKTKEQKLEILAKYMLIILAALSVCLMPTLVGSGLDIEPRTSIAFGSTIGISLLLLYTLFIPQGGKVLHVLVYILVISIGIANAILYYTVTQQHIQTNQKDREICALIKEAIVEYETQTGVKITNVLILLDENITLYTEGAIQTPGYNRRAMASWAAYYALCYYLEKDFPDTEIKEGIGAYSIQKDWDTFSEEQIKMKGNTLYYCIY